MSTEHESVTDISALPDPELACEGLDGPHELYRDPPCPERAIWILTYACCGATVLACQVHLDARRPTKASWLGGLVQKHFTCVKCGTETPADTALATRFTRIERI